MIPSRHCHHRAEYQLTGKSPMHHPWPPTTPPGPAKPTAAPRSQAEYQLTGKSTASQSNGAPSWHQPVSQVHLASSFSEVAAASSRFSRTSRPKCRQSHPCDAKPHEERRPTGRDLKPRASEVSPSSLVPQAHLLLHRVGRCPLASIPGHRQIRIMPGRGRWEA